MKRPKTPSLTLNNATKSVDSIPYISGANKLQRALNKALVAKSLAVDVRGNRTTSGRRVKKASALKGNMFALGLGEIGE